MKKLFTAVILFLVMTPILSLAEETNAETNELEVEEGTEVHGEDISELTEEELQYVPKDWREGDVKPEHRPGKEDEQQSLFRKRYPNVNSYIKKHYGKAVSVKRVHNKDFAQFNYRNGFGAVEGVVAHETANDRSNIAQEIAYMSRNHRNAFVHAFVDHNNIIEIHPVDKGAWGAGRFANERFAHVELVRVNNFSQFAKSINNYSDYIATILYDYGLGVSSADKTGKGTLWSHRAVSKHLGGTTHVDPHGYFARYGYEWHDFVDLVKQKYNAKVKNAQRNTSKLGHIKSSKVKIYKTFLNTNKYINAGGQNTNEVFYIKSEAVHKNNRYYLISRQPSSQKGTAGWVKAADMNTHTHKGIDKSRKTFQINGDGKAFDKAWGGAKNHVYNLTAMKGKTFHVNLSERVGNNEWHRGRIDDSHKTVWIHSSYLSKGTKTKTSKLGHLHGKATEIYKTLGNKASIINADKYKDAVYYIKEQAELNGENYYKISQEPSSTSGVIGWVKTSDMSTHSHVGKDKQHKTFYIKGTGNAYAKAWGGSKDLIFNLSNYEDQVFKVHLTEKVGNNVWYRGTLAGETVWMHHSYVQTEVPAKTSRTSKLGHMRGKATAIYKTLGVKSSAINANNYKDAVYYIKEEAELNGSHYYKISEKPSSTKGVIGWARASDMSTHSHVGKDKQHKTFYIKGSGNAYAKAWGGSKDLIYNLANHKNQVFKVHLTEKVGNNVWYRGTLAGKTVWMHNSYVTTTSPVKTSKTSKLGHLRGKAVNIYQRLGDDSSVINADDYKDAVYYIKEQATYYGDLYYKISQKPSSTQGVVGWVKATDMLTHSHVGKDKKNKNFIVKGTGTAYTKAWGGLKDKVYDMSKFEGQTFKVHLTEKVGKNVWYRGRLNGEVVWLHNSYLQ